MQDWTKCAWCGKLFLPVNVGPTLQKYCKKTHSKKAQVVRQKVNNAGGVCIKPFKKRFNTEKEADDYLIKHHHRTMYSYQCPSTVDVHYHIASNRTGE